MSTVPIAKQGPKVRRVCGLVMIDMDMGVCGRMTLRHREAAKLRKIHPKGSHGTSICTWPLYLSVVYWMT